MSDNELYAIIATAYGDPLPPSLSVARQDIKHGTLGDGLAAFIVNDVMETTDGVQIATDKLDIAINAMEHAGDDIRRVKYALETKRTELE
jgi:hypothetical protein